MERDEREPDARRMGAGPHGGGNLHTASRETKTHPTAAFTVAVG